VDDRTPPDEASPEVHQRIQDSFGRQGLMAHLGARITGIAPCRVHIVFPAPSSATTSRRSERS
jgi:hypothetical protein